MTRFALSICALVCLIAPPAAAQPSVAQCKSTWKPLVAGEKALTCKNMGGARPTKELFGQKYLTAIGTCWDYNVVALQRCGCREFTRSSICCKKGSTKQCEWRIGDSKMVDCKPYGQPPYGLSGNTQPDQCKEQRRQASCFNKRFNFEGAVVGPCKVSPYFTCPKGQEDQNAYLDGKCGATPEDCGCKLEEECSEGPALKCYKEWKANKAAVECYSDRKKYPSPYDSADCYKKVTGKAPERR